MDTTTDKFEENRRRVDDWLNRNGRCPSPHYNADDLSDEDVERKSFTPRGFQEALQHCPICSKDGDPGMTLNCIKQHLKYFCFFCFKILNLNSKDIESHNTIMGHFSDPELLLVHCPFRNCSDGRSELMCLDAQFYYMSGIRAHIRSHHLPVLNIIIAKTEDLGSLETIEDDKLCQSHSSGYISTATMEDYHNNWILDQPNVHQPGTNPSHHKPVEINDYRRRESVASKTTQRLTTPIHIKSIQRVVQKRNYAIRITESGLLLKPESSTSHVEKKTSCEVLFQCTLCHKSFTLRAALQNHQLRKACPFLDDKFCAGCFTAFEGFSTLSCILHLSHCQNVQAANS